MQTSYLTKYGCLPLNFTIPRPFHLFFYEFHFRLKSKTIYKANNAIRNIKCPIVFEFQVSSKSFWTGTLGFQTTKFNRVLVQRTSE